MGGQPIKMQNFEMINQLEGLSPKRTPASTYCAGITHHLPLSLVLAYTQAQENRKICTSTPFLAVSLAAQHPTPNPMNIRLEYLGAC